MCDVVNFTFTINYEEEISISKAEINNQIGKPLTVYVTKYHRVDSYLNRNVENWEWYENDGYEVHSAEPYYFYIRMQELSNANFNFLKSVKVEQGDITDTPIAFAELLTTPKDKNSLQLIVTGKQWENELGDRMLKDRSEDGTFTISVTFVPEKEIDSDLKIKLDFTVKYDITFYE